MKKLTIKYRVTVKSTHIKHLKLAMVDILKRVKKLNIKKVKIIPNKASIYKVTVLKSPFINKTAREQFKILNHKIYLDILIFVENKNINVVKIFEKFLRVELVADFAKINLVKEVYN